MKKYLTRTFIFLSLLTVVFSTTGFTFTPHVYAQSPAQVGVITALSTTGAGAAASAIGNAAFNVVGAVISPIAILALKITSLINMLSGIILNYVIRYTVVEMAAHYRSLPAISVAWGVVRDVANMGFIFVLLYASIQTILGNGDKQKGLVVKMIIAALLINFSLFFTQIAIDASNLVSLTFYNAIAPGATASKSLLEAGLSNSLMQPLSLPSIWKAAGGLNPGNLSTIGILGSVVTLIAAFIFFAVAIMFVIRYVVLIFVLILSPIAFVSDVLPGLSSIYKQWISALTSQALFAPVYMLMTWITIRIFADLVPPVSSWSEAFAGTVKQVTVNGVTHDVTNFAPDAITIVVNFVIVSCFLVASLLIAKSVSSKGGSQINKMTAALGGAVVGSTAWAGRRTFGSAGRALADSEKLKNLDDKGGAAGMAARLTMAAGRKSARSTFDSRAASFGLGGMLGAGKAGGKGGYDQMVKDKTKKEEEDVKAKGVSDIVIDDAKQEVNRHAVGTPERAAAQAKLDQLVGNKDDIEKRTKEVEEKRKKNEEKEKNNPELKAAQEEEKALRDTIRNLNIDLKSTDKATREAAESKINGAKENLEAAQDNTSKLRVFVDTEVKKINDNAESDKKTIKDQTIKGIGDIRKENAATRMSDPGRISTDRVAFVGKVKQSSRQAAANLRKPKKSIADEVSALVKSNEELTKKESEVVEAVKDTKPQE